MKNRKKSPNSIATMVARRTEKIWLLDWLNRPGNAAAALVNDLKGMQAKGVELAPMFKSAKVARMAYRMGLYQQDAIVESFANRKVKERYAQFRVSERAVNARLAVYASHPILSYDIRAARWGGTQSAEEEYPLEWFAITYLVKLILFGKLERIRRCLDCNRWFLARTAAQHCCCQKCRKKYRSQDPKFKAGRVIYMRGQRKRQKDRDLANLKASGRSR